MAVIDTANAEMHPADHNALVYRTGLSFEVPQGWCLEVTIRRTQGAMEAVRLSNGTTIIDATDRSELKIALRWDGQGYRWKPLEGQAVAQARLVPAPQAAIVDADARAVAEGYTRDDESVQLALMLVDVGEVPLEDIALWSLAQCRQAHEWAMAAHCRASDNDVEVPAKPAFLEQYGPATFGSSLCV
nr:dUTP diphosphatase [Cupriavidus pauculus]